MSRENASASEYYKWLRAVSPVVASLLLIMIAIAASYLLYSVIISQQTAAKQASGPQTLMPEISIEGVMPTNYSITIYIRVDKAPTTLENAYLYDINNTLVANLFTLTPLNLTPGTVTPVEMFSDTELPPGHYRIKLTTPQGAFAEKYFENPTGTGKTTVLDNLTTAYTSDTNSLNTSDSYAIYKAWIDTLADRVYFNVTALVDITYLRVALYNNSATNLVDLGPWNPYERTTLLPATSYDSQYWEDTGLSTWGPFTLVYTIKTS